MKVGIRCMLACLAALCALLGTAALAEDAQPRTLIAYYSHTGNTQEAATELAGLTGGDLARIERAQAYPEDNDAFLELAEQEIKEGAKPEITVTLSDGRELTGLADYDIVYVGYPIWWDDAPAMIASFLDSYDFSGKTVAPFCTSAYSAIDNSLHVFEELCPDANLAQGLTVTDEARLANWAQAVQAGERQGAALGKQVRLTAGDTQVVVTLNGSRAAEDLAQMLPLTLTLIERNGFAKGMTLPEVLSDQEPTTRDYVIGDFGYWAAGPDLAIFYDDIYEKTIVDVIPLGHADSGAQALRNCTGEIRLELVETP
ncbi:MAG: cyclophilin-like fold protein [Clostridia bacterium]|nr:cyclophilin-like fold protein [Clostridia bacterium]